MKKILAFVLAMVMVMGMVVVSNASVTATTEFETIDERIYMIVTIDGLEYTDELNGVFYEVDETGAEIDMTEQSNAVSYAADVTDWVDQDITTFEVYALINTTEKTEATKLVSATYEAETVVAVQEALVRAVWDAYWDKNTTAVIRLDELVDSTIYAEDWLWLQNAYAADEWAVMDQDGEIDDDYDAAWTDDVYNWCLLNMSLIVVDPANDAQYRISADAIANFTAADVDFELRTTAAAYTVLGTTYTASEVYAKIRELTGDTKNPFVFGWDSADVAPEMTVSIVIPQQWINVYGHKDLTLFVFDMASDDAKCEICGADIAEMVSGASDDTTVTANTQTQRIVFSTSKLYKTLVLSAAALAAEEDAAAAEDANPNTGANDMVNVAVVFSVVALVAAAAFVASKQH